MIQPMRRSVTASSKKCMLTLSIACQVKPIRIGASNDSANEKDRLNVLKEMHAHSQYSMSGKAQKNARCKVKPVRSSVCDVPAYEKGRKSAQPLRRSVKFYLALRRHVARHIQGYLS